MTGQVAFLCRHPVKSLGEERLTEVELEAGKHMPWDRVWAICHGNSVFDSAKPEWVRARNFVTQTFVPNLARISMEFDEGTGVLSLKHPDQEPISVDPESEGEALCKWLLPLAQAQRPGPYRLARIPNGALTDYPDTHIAINSTRSLTALEEASGTTLRPNRFRGNIWLEGLPPWEELGWVGREVAVGDARLKVTERILRCNATTANSETGFRDIAVPQVLEDQWGHMDFGVYAQVIGGGKVKTGDPVTLV